MTRSTIVNLSLAQAGGLVVTTIGSIAVWFVAASIVHPSELGVLGRVISTGTLVASFLTAGLGQFLLAVVRNSDAAQVRRLFLIGLIGGALASALVGLLVGLAQIEHSLILALATAGMAAGVAATNLQDSVYLSTQQARDVPLKSAALVFSRLVLLLICKFARFDGVNLIGLFLLTQVLLGCVWIAVRMPVALRRHSTVTLLSQQPYAISAVLVSSYCYSIAVAAIMTGVPALVTSITDPQTAGKFYMAWTIASVLASVAIAIANSIVAVTLGAGRQRRRFLYVLAGLVATLSIGGIATSFAGPFALNRLHTAYVGIERVLAFLVVGNVFFGIAVVSLAVYRSRATLGRLIRALIAWPVGIAAGVLIGTQFGGIQGACQGFAIGNGFAACLLFLATIQALRDELPHVQHAVVGASNG